jgi:hypothetical protein
MQEKREGGRGPSVPAERMTVFHPLRLPMYIPSNEPGPSIAATVCGSLYDSRGSCCPLLYIPAAGHGPLREQGIAGDLYELTKNIKVALSMTARL